MNNNIFKNMFKLVESYGTDNRLISSILNESLESNIITNLFKYNASDHKNFFNQHEKALSKNGVKFLQEKIPIMWDRLNDNEIEIFMDSDLASRLNKQSKTFPSYSEYINYFRDTISKYKELIIKKNIVKATTNEIADKIKSTEGLKDIYQTTDKSIQSYKEGLLRIKRVSLKIINGVKTFSSGVNREFAETNNLPIDGVYFSVFDYREGIIGGKKYKVSIPVSQDTKKSITYYGKSFDNICKLSEVNNVLKEINDIIEINNRNVEDVDSILNDTKRKLIDLKSLKTNKISNTIKTDSNSGTIGDFVEKDINKIFSIAFNSEASTDFINAYAQLYNKNKTKGHTDDDFFYLPVTDSDSFSMIVDAYNEVYNKFGFGYCDIGAMIYDIIRSNKEYDMSLDELIVNINARYNGSIEKNIKEKNIEYNGKVKVKEINYKNELLPLIIKMFDFEYVDIKQVFRQYIKSHDKGNEDFKSFVEAMNIEQSSINIQKHNEATGSLISKLLTHNFTNIAGSYFSGDKSKPSTIKEENDESFVVAICLGIDFGIQQVITTMRISGDVPVVSLNAPGTTTDLYGYSFTQGYPQISKRDEYPGGEAISRSEIFQDMGTAFVIYITPKSGNIGKSVADTIIDLSGRKNIQNQMKFEEKSEHIITCSTSDVDIIDDIEKSLDNDSSKVKYTERNGNSIDITLDNKESLKSFVTCMCNYDINEFILEFLYGIMKNAYKSKLQNTQYFIDYKDAVELFYRYVFSNIKPPYETLQSLFKMKPYDIYNNPTFQRVMIQKNRKLSQQIGSNERFDIGKGDVKFYNDEEKSIKYTNTALKDLQEYIKTRKLLGKNIFFVGLHSILPKFPISTYSASYFDNIMGVSNKSIIMKEIESVLCDVNGNKETDETYISSYYKAKKRLYGILLNKKKDVDAYSEGENEDNVNNINSNIIDIAKGLYAKDDKNRYIKFNGCRYRKESNNYIYDVEGLFVMDINNNNAFIEVGQETYVYDKIHSKGVFKNKQGEKFDIAYSFQTDMESYASAIISYLYKNVLDSYSTNLVAKDILKEFKYIYSESANISEKLMRYDITPIDALDEFAKLETHFFQKGKDLAEEYKDSNGNETIPSAKKTSLGWT
jgi:hypothetical protein